MTRLPENVLSLPLIGACCPEAQADGVPCTTLGRECETCERAILIHYDESTDEEPEVDSWTV